MKNHLLRQSAKFIGYALAIKDVAVIIIKDKIK
jgi:hypothetical protein